MIEKPIALQILRTLARYSQAGYADIKQLRDIDPPVLRLRARNHRIFFRENVDVLEILRVLDRKEAYR